MLQEGLSKHTEGKQGLRVTLINATITQGRGQCRRCCDQRRKKEEEGRERERGSSEKAIEVAL